MDFHPSGEAEIVIMIKIRLIV